MIPYALAESDLGALVATGRTAEVFAFGTDTVVKLFRDGAHEGESRKEWRGAVAAERAGLPVPGVRGLVTVAGRQGIIFDRIAGAPMMARLINTPESMQSVAERLAELHVSIHEHVAPELPVLHDHLVNDIVRAEIEDEIRHEALRRLEGLPTGESLCHMDFHPLQVIEHGDETNIVDWLTAVQGDPAADVARTALLITVARMDDPALAWLDRGLQRSALAHRYVNAYCERTGMTPAQIEAWFYPLAAGRRAETTDDDPAMLVFLRSGAAHHDDISFLTELDS